MSEQNYVEIKPKHCSKCEQDYTPIIHSDECPHNKVGVSEQYELLLTIEGVLNKYVSAKEKSEKLYLIAAIYPQDIEDVAKEILAKAKPIIEKQERERILDAIDELSNDGEFLLRTQEIRQALEEK